MSARGGAGPVVVVGAGLSGLSAALHLRGGSRLELDHLYSHHGSTPQTELAEQVGNLTLVSGDVRKQDLAALCAALGGGVVAVGNLPYSITTQILQLFWEQRPPIRRMAFMVQKEVAQKLIARPGEPGYCLASLRCRYYCEPRVALDVPARAFTPPPHVDSAFVLLPFRNAPPLPAADEARLWRLATAGFGLRRKTLANALKGVWPATAPDLGEALRSLGLPPTVRGEALALEDWLRLARACPS